MKTEEKPLSDSQNNGSGKDHDGDAHDDNSRSNPAGNYPEDDENQDTSEGEGEIVNSMAKRSDLKEDVDMDDIEADSASVDFARQERDSTTESESNMNMKEDEEMASIADDEKSQEEGKDSQDDFDEEKSEVRTRKTRSASVDDRDPSSINSQDDHEGGSARKKEDSSIDTSEKSSRSVAAAERELLGYREPATTTAPTTSFLDSLSDEQRRVRTRHLPAVAGFRRLHKSEIKRDLALVRKMLKSTAKGAKKTTPEDDASMNAKEEIMDVDGAGGSDNESQSDIDSLSQPPKSKSGRRSDLDVLDNPDLPNIFSLPYTESPFICTDVEGKLTKDNGKAPPFSAPQVVESITAFSPPRPPESVGPKKMHRLNRWERHPQDVEVDLNSYRKTVERTRQELHNAQGERESIEEVGQHLRAHLMSHLQCMQDEMELLDETYESMQTQCVKAAALLTSKTRSRGVSRGGALMKDVLSVLKSRGDAKSAEVCFAKKTDTKPICSLGVGGISDGSKPLLASGWILPGDRVSTDFGEGTVFSSHGPSVLDQQKSPNALGSTGSSLAILPPRIVVELPFGRGSFCPVKVQSMEKISTYSDDRLAKRWVSMIESAKSIGTCVDFAAVDNCDANRSSIVSPSSSVGNREGDEDEDGFVDEGISEMNESIYNLGSSGESAMGNGKILPSGSSLLPSSTYRGGGLHCLSIEELEKNVSYMLSKSGGVLGAVSNPNVPAEYKKWETDREELRKLQGTAQQLRNAVYRQRRIRFLNERNAETSQNCRDRFDMQLSEMKSDLDILKERLKEELNELGLDQSSARQLLSEYYKTEETDLGSEDHGMKRKSEEDYEKTSRMKLEDDGGQVFSVSQ